MPKTFHPDIETLLGSDYYWTLTFIEFIIDPTDAVNGILRLTNHFQDIEYDGNTYTASGTLMGISQYTETTEATNDALNLSLSGIDPSVVASILDTPIAGSTVKIYKGFYNEETGQVIGDPYLAWSGIANSFSIDDTYEKDSDDGVNISVSCKSLLNTLMERQSGLYTSLPSYQNKYPTDYSMEFVAGLADRSFNFGKEK
jgi:hypothetical protein